MYDTLEYRERPSLQEKKGPGEERRHQLVATEEECENPKQEIVGNQKNEK